jgi:hypothetical protein
VKDQILLSCGIHSDVRQLPVDQLFVYKQKIARKQLAKKKERKKKIYTISQGDV